MNQHIAQASDFARRTLPTVAGGLLLLLLWQKAQTLDWLAVKAAFSDISMLAWGVAALASAASFWAVAQYDVVAHRHLRTGVDSRVARNAGAAAIAVGQTTGFGPAVGAALRWRMMPSLGHATVLKITGFVTLSFFAAWGLIAISVALPVVSGVGWLSLLLFPLGLTALCGLLLRTPRLVVLGRRFDLPSVSAFLTLTALAAVDVIFAGTALHVLLPAEIAPSLSVLIAAFTLALGAGMIGGTPGGVGPFELALITVMPGAASPELAAALIAFRVIYYAIPCVTGAAWALLMPAHSHRQLPPLDAKLTGARAEIGIAAQNDHAAIATLSAEGVALRTPQALTLFLGATEGRLSALLPELRRVARSENRLACLYKLAARDAAEARRAGWHVVPFAVEAVIDPARHALDGPEHRQLRRFLRKAEKEGVTYGPITTPDWERMTEIHTAWEDFHGAERGLTMGRFCPLFLRDKPMFGAWLNGELVAFTSWLQAGDALSLDVLRHMADLPQGTMHGLIQTVIDHARAEGLAEVSLAALPHPSLPKRIADCAGLARFKTSFAPRWRSLYIGAPNALALAICAADIRQGILTPAPLPRSQQDIWDLDALVTPLLGPTPEDVAQHDLRRAG
ncbi:phosphatidylglycerol lysyltransferase [Sagittula marina]|uniref:Phosphatidylglycerol lysyltransferase n=1 Tax=Sagittula marina TaxID=943940 RepID=A0A7W6GR97_9RHOB|nr:phosphatidylglycerol lysyltransferase domain-containing protein [Sagittula marina]MBB3985171.1 phosphatidylglycerol lysyltransferase [Sagittula marina]